MGGPPVEVSELYGGLVCQSEFGRPIGIYDGGSRRSGSPGVCCEIGP